MVCNCKFCVERRNTLSDIILEVANSEFNGDILNAGAEVSKRGIDYAYELGYDARTREVKALFIITAVLTLVLLVACFELVVQNSREEDEK